MAVARIDLTSQWYYSVRHTNNDYYCSIMSFKSSASLAIFKSFFLNAKVIPWKQSFNSCLWLQNGQNIIATHVLKI